MDYIVSPLIKDKPVPSVPSSKERCFECSKDIWVSHTIRADLPDALLYCRPCILLKITLEDENPNWIQPRDRKEFLKERDEKSTEI